MERNELAIFQGKVQGIGKIGKFGLRNTGQGKIITVLLVDIDVWADDKQVYIDHAWMGINKKVDASLLKVGNVMEFEATVNEYSKGRDYSNKHAYGLRKLRIKEITKIGYGESVGQFLEKIVNRDFTLAAHSLVV